MSSILSISIVISIVATVVAFNEKDDKTLGYLLLLFTLSLLVYREVSKSKNKLNPQVGNTIDQLRIQKIEDQLHKNFLVLDTVLVEVVNKTHPEKKENDIQHDRLDRLQF